MEQVLQDIDHYARIVAGCESINHVLSGNGKLTEDGRYAQSVLKLRAQDEFGALAGNESLLEGVKKGARKLKEWIVALVKSVLGYITGSTKKVKEVSARADEFAKKYNSLKADQKEKVQEKAKPVLSAHAKVFLRIVDKLEALQKEAEDKAFEVVGFKPDLGQTTQRMKGAAEEAEDGNWIGAAANLKLAIGNIDGQLNSLTSKLSLMTKLDSLQSGEGTPEINSAAGKVASWLNKATAVSHSMNMNFASTNDKALNWLDEFMLN